ncbi:MAG: HEPN domain-containing protein [Pseudomonadota bacterium]
MLDAGRYTWCAFICQQALEKCLKAGYVTKFKKIPPYTHKLELLCQYLELNPPERIMDIIIKVDKYYIATRYPSYKKSVNITNKSIAVDIYKQVREVFEWLVRMLELKK